MPPVRMDYDRGWEELLKEWDAGRPAPKEDPTELALEEISLARSVMQPRDLDWNIMQSEKHVKNLMKVIRDRPDHKLEPITVWWSGKTWRIVDGHHRYAAYRALSDAPKKERIVVKVPVKVFRGGPMQAVLMARGENSKDKLPMSDKEKSNAAWQMIVTAMLDPERAKSEGITSDLISEKCGRSPRTMTIMRSRVKTILEIAPDANLQRMTWDEARDFTGDPKDPDADDYDKLQERLANEFCQVMQKYLYDRPLKSPKAMAMALMKMSPTLPRLLQREWVELWGDVDGDWEDEKQHLIAMGDMSEEEAAR